MEVTAKKTDGSSSEGLIAPRLTGDALHQADLNNKYSALHDGSIAYVTAIPSSGNAVGQTSNNVRTVSSNWTTGLTSYLTAIKFGDALLLPGAGTRGYDTGPLGYRGNAYYWTSTTVTANKATNLNFYYGGGGTYDYIYRSEAFGIRCISE